MAVYLGPQQRDAAVPHPHVFALTEDELLALAGLVDRARRQGDPSAANVVATITRAANDIVLADTIARREANPKD